MNGIHSNEIPHRNDLDFSRPEFIFDPYPVYERLRMQPGPIYSEFERAWIVSRYEEAALVLRDKRLSSKPNSDLNPILTDSFAFHDPPTHTRLRNLLQETFSPKRVVGLEEQIEMIADRLLECVIDKKRMDLLEEFSRPLPVAVISEMLGIPLQDQQQLTEWTMAIVEDSPQAALMRLKHKDLCTTLPAFFLRLVDQQRAKPSENLIKVLVDAHDQNNLISMDEIVSTCMLLFIAGHETTMHLFGNAIYCLLQHPEQLAKLKANPELIPSAIEEILRYESPLQKSIFRTATESIVIGGVRIPEGDRIVVLLGSANRDPSVFTNPNRFNIERTPNRHLAFGTGIHACLAATLARMEGRIGIQKLLQRLPDLRLANEVQPVRQQPKTHFLRKLFVKKQLAAPVVNFPIWTSSSTVRGLTSLPLEW